VRLLLNIILCASFFLIFSCKNSSNNSENIWNESQRLYSIKDYNNCIVLLTSILDNNNEEFKPKALFLISEIYLNEYQEYDISISFLDLIIDKYQDNDLAKRALFTKAYIQANYIESYSDAIDLYNTFIEKYPQDDLVSSVNYELNELNKYKTKIDQMINR